MEYCASSLASDCMEMNESRLRIILRDVASGLRQLHALDIVHRKIKQGKSASTI